MRWRGGDLEFVLPREQKSKLGWLGLACVVAALGVPASFFGAQVGVISSPWARTALLVVGLVLIGTSVLESRADVWSVWPETPSFTGREDVLDSIEDRLSSVGGPDDGPRLAVLTGLPGVGKSWAAAAYARRHRRHYRVVWWLGAEDDASIVRDYQELARELGLPPAVAPDAHPQQAALAARMELGRSDRWLLVFDDIPPPTTGEGSPFDRLRPWLPKGAGHVLVTTTDPHWGPVEPVDVAPFPQEAAADFLLARTGSSDTSAAWELAELLGGLPLALEQAASCVPEEIGSLGEFLERFRRSEAALAGMGAVVGHDNVVTSLRVIFRTLATSSPEAIALLGVAAYVSPQRIARRALERHLAAAGDPLGPSFDRPDFLGRALASLRRFSLVDVSGESLAFHSLVQLAARSWFGNEDERLYVAATVKVTWAALDEATSESESVAAVLPHAMAAASHAARLDIEPAAVASTWTAAGHHYITIGRPAEALHLLERALSIKEAFYGPEHVEVGQMLSDVGSAHRILGHPTTARSLDQRAVAIMEAFYGADHPAVAKALGNLGADHGGLGDWAKARDLHQHALAIQEAFYGPEHPEVAGTLSDLAIILDRLGDTNAGARARRRAGGILHIGKPANVNAVDSEPEAYDLWREVCIQASHLERLEVVTTEDEAPILERFGDAFLRDSAPVPWWESLSLPRRVVPYGERDEALNDVLRPALAVPAYLFATTDSGTLYGTVHGTVSNLLRLLAATSPFSFALTDADMTWVVFDTPPNELVVAGAVL